MYNLFLSHQELRQPVNTEEILKAILFHSGEALDYPYAPPPPPHLNTKVKAVLLRKK